MKRPTEQQINIDWPEWSDVVLRKDSIDDPHDTYMFARHNPETNNTLWSAPGMFSHEVDMSGWHVYWERDISAAQPRKAVSDAVDYFDGVWRSGEFKVLSWRDDEGCWSWGGPVDGEYQVCTREEFEAEVERRKGEEWTHVDLEGDRCKVIHTHDNYVWVQYDSGKHSVYKSKFISKRKPTISKAEAWNKAVNEDVSPFYILENYEVK